MKFQRIICAVAVLTLLLTVFVGCTGNGIKLNKEYSHTVYSTAEWRFVASGSTLTIKDDYTFVEKYPNKDGGFHELGGNYTDVKKLGMFYTKSNSSSLSSFKKAYKTELKALGYSTSDIDTILGLIQADTEVFRYNGYMFKIGSVCAARTGSNLTKLDGIYNFSGQLINNSSEVKFERNVIYMEETDEFGDKSFTKRIGTYQISGDFITVTPEVALSGGSVNPPAKYLIAEVELPATYDDEKDENGNFKDNDIIKVYVNVKIKVLISDFYTLKSIE